MIFKKIVDKEWKFCYNLYKILKSNLKQSQTWPRLRLTYLVFLKDLSDCKSCLILRKKYFIEGNFMPKLIKTFITSAKQSTYSKNKQTKVRGEREMRMANKIISLVLTVSFILTNTTFGLASEVQESTLRQMASAANGVAAAAARDLGLPKSSSAGALSQADLAELYIAQSGKKHTTVQAVQTSLRETLIAEYSRKWQEKLAEIQAKYPDFKAPFDAANPDAQALKVTRELAEAFNILWDQAQDLPAGHLKELFDKSDNSTAGIRAFFDIINNENPSNMYNDMLYALLCEAEAQFLKEVHKKEIKSKIPRRGTRKFRALIAKLEANLSQEEIDIILEMYGMEGKTIADVVAFVRENPVKLVGGEVRPNSSKLIEIETRIMAGHGITVLTPARHLDNAGNPVYDSSTICMFSFLTYKLGACGATFLTPSHSACYVLGRKALGPSGQQLLLDTYEKYRNIIKNIVRDKIFGRGRPVWRMAPVNDPHIHNTLTYERATRLYAMISNLTPEDVAVINEATEKGHRIKLNNLNGATWKTLLPILEAQGIDPRVFDDPETGHEVMLKEENGLFSVGYYIMKIDESAEQQVDGTVVVTQVTDGKISKKTILPVGSAVPEPTTVYKVGHYGVDTTMGKVVNTIPYPAELRGLPMGTKVYECDPDSDRFVVKQIMKKDAKTIELLDEYGIEYYDLGDGRILAAPSPNKIFLTLDIMDYERMVENGTWGDYISLYFITYVSSRAWGEFGEEVGLFTMLCRVGFKNLNEAEVVIKDWYEHNRDYATMQAENPDIISITDEKLVLRDQLGREVEIPRYKDAADAAEAAKRIELELRTHSKAEESGGRVAGLNAPSMNILGQTAISMPEKSDPDAVASELLGSSKAFLSSDGKAAQSRGGEYIIANFLDSRFDKYGMESKIDGRFDILHGDEGAIAQMNTAQEKARAMAMAGANKINFNNFFFSIGRAVRDGEITPEKAKEILKAVLPKYSAEWDAMESITQTDEPLSGGRTRPEGVPLVFEARGEDGLVLELDFRPSGTDPLKSKLYFDAERLSPEQKKALEKYFNALTRYDLYAVLEHYGVTPSVARPALLDELELGVLELGKGPQVSKSSSAGYGGTDGYGNAIVNAGGRRHSVGDAESLKRAARAGGARVGGTNGAGEVRIGNRWVNPKDPGSIRRALKGSSAGNVSIAVSIGGHKVAVNLVDSDGKLLLVQSNSLKWRQILGTSPESADFYDRSDDFMDEVIALIEQALRATGQDISSISDIGVSFAGPIDSAQGIAGPTAKFRAPNTPFDNYNIVQALQARVADKLGRESMPVRLVNDCRSAWLGEQRSPKGRLRDSTTGEPLPGYVVIIGGGINIDAGPEYSDVIDEMGHHLVPTHMVPSHYARSDGAYTFISLEATEGGHPQDADGQDLKGDFEDRFSGPNIAKAIAGGFFKQGENGLVYKSHAELSAHAQNVRRIITERCMQARDQILEHTASFQINGLLRLLVTQKELTEGQESIRSIMVDIVLRALTEAAQKGNPEARDSIKDIGIAVGQALAAFLYAFKDEPIVERGALVSGVNENLGLGVQNDSGGDLYLASIREAIVTELVRSYGMQAARAVQLANELFRSELTFEREIIAFAPAKSSSAGSTVDITVTNKKDGMTLRELANEVLSWSNLELGQLSEFSITGDGISIQNDLTSSALDRPLPIDAKVTIKGNVKASSAGLVEVRDIEIGTADLELLRSTDNASKSRVLDKIFAWEFHSREFEETDITSAAMAPGRDPRGPSEHSDYPDQAADVYAIGCATADNYMTKIGMRSDGKIRILHATAEQTIEFDIKDLKELQRLAKQERDQRVPDAKREIPLWAVHALAVLIRAQEDHNARFQGMDIIVSSSIPYGAGLSNSAANCVSIGMVVNDLCNLGLSKFEIAKLAQAAEHDDFVGGECGLLDQLLSIFGEALINFRKPLGPDSVQEVSIGLPDSIQRVSINTNFPRSLPDTEYNDRKAELLLVHGILSKVLGYAVSSTSLTLGDLNHLIYELTKNRDLMLSPEQAGFVGDINIDSLPQDTGLDLTDDQLAQLRRASDTSVKLPRDKIDAILRYVTEVYTKPELNPDTTRHTDISAAASFVLLLRRMRHQLTDPLRIMLYAKACKEGDIDTAFRLVTAAGKSLKIYEEGEPISVGDFQITGRNGAQDALLRIAYEVADEVEIKIAGRMSGGGGGGFDGFYVDRTDEGKYQRWLAAVVERYNAWAAGHPRASEVPEPIVATVREEGPPAEGASMMKTKASSAGTMDANAKLLADAVQYDTGELIVINPLDASGNVRQDILDAYDRGSDQLQQLEAKLGCTIRLSNQVEESDIQGKEVVLISDTDVTLHHQELARNKDSIKRVGMAATEAQDQEHPIAFIVLIATQLFGERTPAELEQALNRNRIFAQVFGQPATRVMIQQFLTTGFFELPVPMVDYEAVEDMQRAALLAAISA